MNFIKNNYFNIFIFIFFVSSGLTDVYISITSIFFLFYIFKNMNNFNYLNKPFLFSIFFYLSLILSSIISNDITSSLSRSLPYIRFIFFISFGIYYFNNINHKIPINLLNFFLFFLSIDIFFQYIFGFDFFGFESVYEGNFRNSGFFGDEKIAGSILCDLGMISIVLMKYLKMQFNRKSVFYLLQLIIFISIIYTGERMAFIRSLTFITIFYFFYMDNLTIAIKSSFLIILVFFTFLAISSNENLQMRYKDIQNKIYTQKSGLVLFDQGHGLLWKSAYKLFLDNPVFGVGTKNFRIDCSQNFNDESFDKISEHEKINSICSTHPHNYFLELISENGLVGLFLFFISIYFFYISHVKINYLFLPLLIKLFPFFISGSYFHNYNGILLCFMFIISTINSKR